MECFRVLKSGCRLCINVGDQFARAAYYGRYKVVPIHSEIIRFCETIGFDYMGAIIWQKPTIMHTSGGSNVMGSYPYPRGGILKIDYEYICCSKSRGQIKSHLKRKEMHQSSLTKNGIRSFLLIGTSWVRDRISILRHFLKSCHIDLSECFHFMEILSLTHLWEVEQLLWPQSVMVEMR